MNNRSKETQLYDSSTPIDWGVLATPLLHSENGNGAHRIDIPTKDDEIAFVPSYLTRFTPEDIVELLLQGKQLEEALKKHPYPSKEHGEDHIREGRRMEFDSWTTWKRSDLEVKRYNAIITAVEASNHGDALLTELISRWVTPLNIVEIAKFLYFTPEDVAKIVTDKSKSALQEPSANQPPSTIDKNAHWYQLLLEAFSEDDIVPLVLGTELTIKSKNKPTLDQIYKGLQQYFGRVHFQTRMSNDLMDVKIARLKKFTHDKHEIETAVLQAFQKLAEQRIG